METNSSNAATAAPQKLDFNALRAEAKGLGINTKGMNAITIKIAIDAHNTEAARTEKRGRHIDPTSARQQRLAKVGTVKRGRKPDPTSPWHKKQAELQAKKEAAGLKEGEKLPLGRKVDPTSERQQRLAKVGTVKRGRPAMAKVEEPVVEAPKATATATVTAKPKGKGFSRKGKVESNKQEATPAVA